MLPSIVPSLSLSEVTDIAGGGTSTTGTAQNFAGAIQGAQGKNLKTLAVGLATVIAGPIIGGLLAAFGFIKGKTERLSGSDATRIANDLAPSIYSRILSVATTAQRNYLAEHLPGRVIDYIVKSDWWNEREVDNINTSMAFHAALVNTPGGSDVANPWRIERSIWELIHWAAKNSPKDQTLFQEHLQQIFSGTVGQEMQQAYVVLPGDVGGSADPGASAPPSVPVWVKFVLGGLGAAGFVFGMVKVVKG